MRGPFESCRVVSFEWFFFAVNLAQHVNGMLIEDFCSRIFGSEWENGSVICIELGTAASRCIPHNKVAPRCDHCRFYPNS